MHVHEVLSLVQAIYIVCRSSTLQSCKTPTRNLDIGRPNPKPRFGNSRPGFESLDYTLSTGQCKHSAVHWQARKLRNISQCGVLTCLVICTVDLIEIFCYSYGILVIVFVISHYSFIVIVILNRKRKCADTTGTVLVPRAGHFPWWNINKYIFQIKYTEAILSKSNSTRKLLWFGITKKLIAFKKNKYIVSLIAIFRTLPFPIVRYLSLVFNFSYRFVNKTSRVLREQYLPRWVGVCWCRVLQDHVSLMQMSDPADDHLRDSSWAVETVPRCQVAKWHPLWARQMTQYTRDWLTGPPSAPSAGSRPEARLHNNTSTALLSLLNTRTA